jgi:hypothetical protein
VRVEPFRKDESDGEEAEESESEENEKGGETCSACAEEKSRKGQEREENEKGEDEEGSAPTQSGSCGGPGSCAGSRRADGRNARRRPVTGKDFFQAGGADGAARLFLVSSALR